MKCMLVGRLVFLGALLSLSYPVFSETPKLTLDEALAAAESQPCAEAVEGDNPAGKAPGQSVDVGSPKACAPGELGWEKPCPLKELSLTANYYFWSDYIFRGVNMSEYLGEGREKPVHQMDVGGEYKLTPVFGLGGKFFASWVTADDQINQSDQNIQEYRYTPYVFADLAAIASRVMVGFNFFEYPHAPPGRHDDMEWWFQICHNDAWMWKALWPDNEKGVLNPFLFVAQNIDEAEGGMAALLGIKHDFAVPGVPYLTLTPQLALAGDHRLVGKLVADRPVTNLLFLQYGLTVTYDIGKLLKVPPQAGNFTISGNLYYSEAFADYLHDELYGGAQVGWSW